MTRKTPITTATAAVGGLTALALVFTPMTALAAELDAPAEEHIATEQAVEEATPSDEVAPEAVEEASVEAVFTPFAAPALVDTSALTPLGITGTRQVGPSESIEYDRYMPSVRSAHISGLAKPETSGGARPDEPVIDLRALVGTRGGPTGTEFQTSGYSYTDEGALFETPSATAPGVTGFAEMLDWSEYTWRIDAVGAVGLMNTADIDGRVAVVPFAESAQYGITATLVHIATGVEAAPVTITGYTGVNSGGEFDWAYSATPAAREGGVSGWSAQAAGYPENRLMTNRDQRETVIGSGERQFAPLTPAMFEGALSDTGIDYGTPAGFDLWERDGHVVPGPVGIGLTARAGALYNEAIESVSMNLAERFDDVVAVALPGAESGTLTLAPSGFAQPRTGLMYQAADGLTLRVDGTVVRADFGSAQWSNLASVWVRVLLADGTSEMREVAFESRPSDTAGGLIEKRIPTSTSLFITDAEMLEASRLSGLEPTVATVNALDLPEGVTRVAGGFAYEGSEEPTTLAFGFSVAEVFETPSGPVIPDSSGDGEVRIAVFAGTEVPEVPVDPETPTPEVPTPETPAPEKPAEAAPPASGPKVNPGANTGDLLEAVAGGNPAATGIFGALTAALGILLGFVVGRRTKASASPEA